MREAVVVDVIRTPSGRGKPGGALSGVHPVDLLAGVLEEIVERSNLDPTLIDDVIVGAVSQAGEQSSSVGRHAVLGAGFPEAVPATTSDRQCGSNQQAVAFAAQAIASGMQDIVIAGGVEPMSRVPLGTADLGQDILGIQLRERYPDGLVHQGVSAELVAAKRNLARERLDEFAVRSHELALAAWQRCDFEREVVSVVTPSGRVISDEIVRAGTTAEGLAGLQPSFAPRSSPLVSQRLTGGSPPVTPHHSQTGCRRPSA